MSKLNQIIAVEKGIKARIYSELTEVHKVCQKPDLFNGFQKTYIKKDDDGEDYPPESKKVQLNAASLLGDMSSKLTDLFDVTATKDYANCAAKANVVIDDVVILTQVPATHLLFLEKQLNDLRTFIEKLPVLDEAEDWEFDNTSGVYKTKVVKTHRSKKIQRAIVLYDATVEHPAQTQLISEDVTVGYWDTVKRSGAIAATNQAVMLAKVDALQKAVKFAREQANDVEAPNQSVGRAVFDYLLH